VGPADERPAARDAPGGPLFWASNALGTAIVVFGVLGLLRHRDVTVPSSWLTFLAGSVIAHDAIWAPLVGLLSLAVVRVVPRRVRPALQGTLLVSAAVVLVAIPVLTGRGRNPNNPSILPGHYGTALLEVLAVVWAAGALVALRALRRPPTAEDPAPPPALPPQNGW
jgi:hypothetical protein